MNAKQIQFLYNQGLINPDLFKGLESRMVGAASDANAVTRILGKEIIALTLAKYLTLLAIFFLPFSLILYETGFLVSKVVSSIGLGFCGVGIPTFLLGFVIVGWKPYSRIFLELNNLLATWRNEDGKFQKYNLNQDWEWLKEKADKVLISTASELIESEWRSGVYYETTVKARKQFKHAHEILLRFNLCEENQGIYIRAAQKRLDEYSASLPK